MRKVKVLGGMAEFVGKTGTVVEELRDGRTKLLRVKLDTPVEVPGVGTVTADLWEPRLLRTVRSAR